MQQEITNNQNESLEQKDKSGSTGCLKTAIGVLFALFILYILVTAVPGFLAYRDKGKRLFALPFLKTIHASLKIYSGKKPQNLFPAEINDYESLSQIVNDAGKSLPKNQTDTKIDYFKYETTDRGKYILRINIESNPQCFYILYPNGIIEVNNFDSGDDKSVMELVRTLLQMDWALHEKGVSEYLKYYTPDTSIHIKHTYIEARPADKNTKTLPNTHTIAYTDLDSYSKALLDFYRNTLPGNRKREEIFIRKNGQDWEVHSGYIEECTIKGQKCSIEGRSLYAITLLKKPKYIIKDTSYASIHSLDVIFWPYETTK